MRVTIMSSTGASRGFTYYLNSEGHTVTTCTNGDITFIPDIAITDILDTELTENLRKQGVKVLGCTSWSKLLETNGDYQHATIRALGFNPLTSDTKGDRVTLFCIFNGNKIVSKCLVFPYKRFMSSDVGVEVACSGFLSYFDIHSSKLANLILDPLEKYLRKAAHKGCFTVDCIVDKGDIYVEAVSGDTDKAYISSVFENSRLNKSDVLLRVFDEASSPVPYVEPWSCGVLVSVAPFPFYQPKEESKVDGFNPFNLKHLWLIDAEKEGDQWVCGKNNGTVGYVTSRGTSIQKVARRAYRTLSNIHTENIQYRSDIGKDVYDRFARLQAAKLV